MTAVFVVQRLVIYPKWHSYYPGQKEWRDWETFSDRDAAFKEARKIDRQKRFYGTRVIERIHHQSVHWTGRLRKPKD